MAAGGLNEALGGRMSQVSGLLCALVVIYTLVLCNMQRCLSAAMVHATRLCTADEPAQLPWYMLVYSSHFVV